VSGLTGYQDIGVSLGGQYSDGIRGGSLVAGAVPAHGDRAEFQAAISFQEQLDLFDYWDKLRNGSPFPMRGDFDPTQVFSTLGSLGLIEVSYPEDDRLEPEFRYRLVGSDIQAFFEESLKGKSVQEAKNPAYAVYLTGIYNAVVRLKAPICVQENNCLPSGYYIFRGRIYLPAEPDASGRPTILIYNTLDPGRGDLRIARRLADDFPQDDARVWVLSA